MMQLEILDTTNCILCLEYKERMPCDSEGSLKKIVSILCRHFWFDRQDVRNQFVCRNCWQHVEEFQRFYKKVLRAHARAELKQNLARSSLLHAPKHEELNARRHKNIQRPVKQLGLVSDLIKDSAEVYPVDCAVSSDPLSAAYSSSEPTRRTDRTVSYDHYDGLANMCCRLKCAECGMTCPTVPTLRTHFRTVHKKKIFMDCCGRHFRQHSRSQNYAQHNIDTKTITDIACRTFFSLPSRNDHTAIDGPAPAPHIHKRTTRISKRSLLNSHVARRKVYKCEDCDRNFTTHAEWNSHREQHKLEQQLKKSPQCSECSKSFASEASVKRHMETVHGPERYICDVCSKAFKSLAQLRHHQKIHHEPSRGVECKICRKWLKNLPNLSKHMQRHGSSAKQNICDVCGKTSPNASALKAHKKFVHMKEKSFLCAICGKAFKRAVTLKEHLTTHTGGFLYSCPYCSKKFNSNANMHSHKKKMHPSEWEHSRKQYENRFKEHKERLKVSSTAFETDVINTITLHFWFTNEVAQKHFVCNDCWKQLDEFDKFYKEVELTHETTYCIEVAVECPKSSTNVQEVYWDDGSDADDIDEKIERIFDVVQEQHQKKSCVDDLSEKDDMDAFDAKQNGTCNEVHEGTMLKEFASIDVIDALDEGHSYPEHSFGLSDIEDEPSDTEIGISLAAHNKILSKQCETPALTPVPENTSYKCQSCDTIFVKQYQLNAHEQFCKRYKCVDCEHIFSDLKQLISHRKQHKATKRGSPEQGGQAHQCTECSKSFPTEEAVDRHIAYVHYPENFFMCDICAKSFKKKSDYNIHKRRVHLKEYISVECKICKKWLKDVTYLNVHIRKCHKTKNYTCDTCGKVFSTNCSLKYHVKNAHIIKETFVCSTCGKYLSSKNSLKEHCATHTGDYLYTCPYCPKKFNSSANRFVHKKKMHNLEWQKEREQRQNRYKPGHTVRRSGNETMETL